MIKDLFKDKKVLVMGLGLNNGGVTVAKFFAKHGAKVLVTDLKTKHQLKDSIKKLKGLKIKYSLGGHQEADFLDSDLVVKNPDVKVTSPYLEIARRNGIRIESDISLFLKLSKAFVIGVTGTKGKSTTASLIYHLLKQKHKNTFIAGNIGVSPLELLDKIKEMDFVVLELSSFELEDLSQSPNVAVITNIMPDHLNRYLTMKEYIEAKKQIFRYQTEKDILVLNNDDSVSVEFAKETKSKVYFFSAKEKISALRLTASKLFGSCNLSNLSAAVTVAKLMKVSEKDIKKGIKTFKGVVNRQEFVKEAKGVKYFNDTTATMPEAVLYAMDVFLERYPNSKLIFICGGQNKGLNYSGLSIAIREKISKLILLPGTASNQIKQGLLGYNNLHEVSSMKEAVSKVKELAKRGDIVVLSPGAASFNMFKNEFDRGDQFVSLVKKIR